LMPSLMKDVLRNGYDLLLKNHIVFGVAVSELLDQLPMPSVIVLQDVFAMRGEECGRIIRFVKNGGKVIVLGPTSWLNERGQDASAIGLSGLVAGDRLADWEHGKQVVTPDVFIEPTPAAEAQGNLKISRRFFDADRRKAVDLRAVIAGLLPEALSITSAGPEHVFVDAYRTQQTQTAIHLYNINNDTECRDVEVSAKRPERKTEIKCLSPDFERTGFSVSEDAGRLKIKVEKLHTYCVLII